MTAPVKTLNVKVEEFQEETQKVANRDVEEPAKADKLGLSVRPLGADERKSAETEGYLLVEDVDGPAAQAGVRPGDVILGVNGKPVKSMAELRTPPPAPRRPSPSCSSAMAASCSCPSASADSKWWSETENARHRGRALSGSGPFQFSGR